MFPFFLDNVPKWFDWLIGKWTIERWPENKNVFFGFFRYNEVLEEPLGDAWLFSPQWILKFFLGVISIRPIIVVSGNPKILLWENKWVWIYQQQKRMHLISFRRKWEAQLRRSTRQGGEGLPLRSWPMGEGENDQLSRRSYRRMVIGFPAWKKKWQHPSNTWLIFRPGKSLRQAARLVKTMASLLW